MMDEGISLITTSATIWKYRESCTARIARHATVFSNNRFKRSLKLLNEKSQQVSTEK